MIGTAISNATESNRLMHNLASILTAVIIFEVYTTSLMWGYGIIALLTIVFVAIFMFTITSKTASVGIIGGVGASIAIVVCVGLGFGLGIGVIVGAGTFASACIGVFAGAVACVPEKNNWRFLCGLQGVVVVLLFVVLTNVPPRVTMVQNGVMSTTNSWVFGVNPFSLSRPLELHQLPPIYK